MKLHMCCEIVKNFGRLMSFDFWRAIYKDPSFLKVWVLCIFFAAITDIYKMITRSNYPSQSEATE